MGRKPSPRNVNLPPRMRARVKGGRTYYSYDTGGRPRKEIQLGTDYVLAVQKWAELHQATPTERITVAWVIGKYLESPQFDAVSLGTQADYKFALTQLARAFGDAPIDEVRPSHVTLYLDRRSAQSRHRALREKDVLSMVYAWALARDYCASNPVAAVKTQRLPGRRNVYIEDDAFDAVYGAAAPDLRDAMDLGYFIGQRPGDLLDMTMIARRDGWLEYRQNKTGTPQRIKLSDDLVALIERIEARKAQHKVYSMFLLVNEAGKKMTKAMLRSRFEAARSAAGIEGKDFQFRDLRRKAGTDLRDQSGLDAAQDLLGHRARAMTEHYTAARGRQITLLPKKASK